tara:strand:+ start:3204 stop:3881 length:678 start_codon:yes stop_codon:yes gene_type:complete
MNILIKKTNRKKTIAIQINEGLVVVSAPKTISKTEIDSFIQKKLPWIKKKLQIESEKIIPERKKYLNGEYFLFMEKKLKLNITSIKGERSCINDCEIKIVLKKNDINNSSKIKIELEKIYKKYAFQILKEKTFSIADSLNVNPKRIKVRSYKRRWGSCSHDKNISYNWKLIMAPEKIINYVIVHELCHLIHFNHSRDFWNSVSDTLPDYKSSKEWLKLNQDLFNW